MRVYTIPEFCEAERISPSFYFKMRKKGLGPREMRIGPTAVRITEESRLDWHREREAATEAAKATEAA